MRTLVQKSFDLCFNFFEAADSRTHVENDRLVIEVGEVGEFFSRFAAANVELIHRVQVVGREILGGLAALA